MTLRELLHHILIIFEYVLKFEYYFSIQRTFYIANFKTLTGHSQPKSGTNFNITSPLDITVAFYQARGHNPQSYCSLYFHLSSILLKDIRRLHDTYNEVPAFLVERLNMFKNNFLSNFSFTY